MSNVDEKISKLEVEIDGYQLDLKNATTEERMLLLQTINSRRENLNRLMDEKKVQSGGICFILIFLMFIFFLFIFI
jgi:hypothetical protein